MEREREEVRWGEGGRQGKERRERGWMEWKEMEQERERDRERERGGMASSNVDKLRHTNI